MPLHRLTALRVGVTDLDATRAWYGQFGLDDAPCIGLSDQEPAMLLDDVVFSDLTPEKVFEIVAALRAGKSAEELANPEEMP